MQLVIPLNMNSGEIAYILLIILIFTIFIIGLIRSGDLKEIFSFTKMMKDMQNDTFDGETRTFAVQMDGVDGTIEIRTMNDFSDAVFGMRKSAIIYLETSGKMGKALEIHHNEVENDDIIKVVESIAGELIREQDFNMDKDGPMGLMSFISEVLKSASPDGEEWWN